MKEISYEGESFKNEESAWLKNHRRSAPTVPPAIISEPEKKAAPPIVVTQAQTLPTVQEVTPLPDKAPAGDAENEEHHLGLIIFVLTLVLAFGIGVGAYVLGGINKKTDLTPIAPVEIAEEATANTAQYTDILLSDSPRVQILVDVALAFKNTSLAERGVHHVTFTVNNKKGGVQPATFGELLQAIQVERIPEALLNSLENTVAYEIPSGSPLAGRLILTSRSYAHTFGAFFDWEDGMTRTLTPLLHPILDTSYIKDLEGRKFHDERIDTIDTRVLLDAMDNVVLIYGFTDTRTLVIAGSRETFLMNTPK